MKSVVIIGTTLFLFSCSASVAPVSKEPKNGGFTKEQAQHKPDEQDKKDNAEQKPETPEQTVNSVTTDPNIMNLDEAKAQCALCHQPGGGAGADAWSTANGTEEDWKGYAVAARAAVEENKMPPPSGMKEPDRTRMLAFLNKLIGVSPSPTPTATPTEVSYNFDSAKALCVSCHGRGQRSPRLTSTNDWRSNKRDIISEVRDGNMPRGTTLSSAERDALIRFVRSF